MPSPARSPFAALSRSAVARWALCAGTGAVLMTSALAGTSSAASTATTLKAAADSWVSASAPTVNRGTAGYLQVDASPVLRGYVRFTVPVPSGDRVDRAVLTLTPNQSNSAGITVRTASSSWTETGLTYANAPAPGSTVVARSGALTAGVPVRLDVTSAVPAAGGPVTLVVENASGTSFSLRSREQATGAPSLQVTTTATAPTTTVAAPTPAPTSTTTSPTTTTSQKLTWAPPALSNPVTYRVSGSGPGTIKAPAGQDSIVVFDGPVNRRLIMSGGRHWVVRGGEVNNDRTWADWNDQSGLQFNGVQGTAFVEGVLIHGRWGTDGIRVSNSSGTTLVVQNSRIVDRVSHGGFHADVIQPFGGIKALKVDRLTGAGNYQGQMWKQEPGTYFGPTDFRRVNFRKTSQSSQSMFNFVTHSPTQPVTLAEVYHEPYGIDFCRSHFPSAASTCATDSDGRKYVTFSKMAITVNGRITQGLPPGGDFVPAAVAGLGYVSPGYL